MPLDRGYIQTIADLRSDHRTLLLYAADGRFIRSSQLEVPMAVVSTDPQSERIIAVRDVGRQEVAVYKWRWRPE
jgi:hypothetical protein